MERFPKRQQKSETMRIEIPEYRLREWHRHLKRIVENARCDSTDTRTTDALRLARKDLRSLEKYITTES